MPEDTLYLVFEEDVRWWRPSQDSNSADEYERETKTRWMHPKDKPVSLPPPQRGSEDAEGAAKGGGKRGHTRRESSEVHAGVQRGHASPDLGAACGLMREVADATRIANFANPGHLGHMMNMCWVAQGSPYMPTNGTMFMIVSKIGARPLSIGMRSMAGHIDLMWKNWLWTEAGLQDEAGFSFSCAL